jgi:hypothetical protein
VSDELSGSAYIKYSIFSGVAGDENRAARCPSGGIKKKSRNRSPHPSLYLYKCLEHIPVPYQRYWVVEKEE